MRKGKKQQRIIEQLRKLYPGEWKFDMLSPTLRWVGSDFSVVAVAQSAGRYEGEDRYYAIYVMESNGRQIQGIVDNRIYSTAGEAVKSKGRKES